jgi:phosphatidylglycerophosphate synthase
MPAPGSPADGPGRGGSTPTKPKEVEELVDEYFHRPLAQRVVRLLLLTPITPNQVTLISGIVGVAASIAIALGARDRRWILAGGILLFVSVILDCCDGQLARARKISSTTGAILDGIADYIVGTSVAIGATYFMVHALGSPWYWLLGLVALVSIAAQSALFDHAKTRYIARVAGGYSEREEDVERVAAARREAWRAGRYRQAAMYWIYERYSRAQHAALAIPPVADPAAYRAANAGRMRAWTFLGIGTHLGLAYVLCVVAYWWAPAAALYFLINATVFNLLLVGLIATERRPARA